MTTLIIVLFVLVALAVLAWLLWPRIKGLFADSETLFWARLQMFVGALWAVLMVTDISPILHLAGLGAYAPGVLIVWGIITEAARRSRTVGGGDLTPKA
jgi:hypothetical protein